LVVLPTNIPEIFVEFEKISEKYGILIHCYDYAWGGNLPAGSSPILNEPINTGRRTPKYSMSPYKETRRNHFGGTRIKPEKEKSIHRLVSKEYINMIKAIKSPGSHSYSESRNVFRLRKKYFRLVKPSLLLNDLYTF